MDNAYLHPSWRESITIGDGTTITQILQSLKKKKISFDSDIEQTLLLTGLAQKRERLICGRFMLGIRKATVGEIVDLLRLAKDRTSFEIGLRYLAKANHDFLKHPGNGTIIAEVDSHFDWYNHGHPKVLVAEPVNDTLTISLRSIARNRLCYDKFHFLTTTLTS